MADFNFENELEELLFEFKDLLVAKNTDYSGDIEDNPFANFQFTADAIGIFVEDAIFYEIAKKYKRAANLHKTPSSALQNESYEDAIKDMLGGCLLMLLYQRFKDQPSIEVDKE